MADADLVLEGGGVKGIGLVGAIAAMTESADPYQFHRIAGTSAGAIVASLLAAGYTAAELKQIMTDLDFAQFEDESAVFKHFRRFGEAFGLLFQEGLYRGEFMHSWIAERLASKGVRTWGDLKYDDPNSSLPAAQQYKLVVVVSDVSRGKELRLPWDYQTELGVSPDSQLIADAVRASASIPFFFRPFHMTADKTVTQGHGEILCTDGGMLSNFPIDIFDRTDGTEARWPTLGVKLSARMQIQGGDWKPDPDALDLAKSLIATMTDAHDQLHIDNPAFASRVIFVDTTGYKSTNFHLTSADKAQLYANGNTAGTAFLATWDWAAWKAKWGAYTGP
jgi:NTE family protein